MIATVETWDNCLVIRIPEEIAARAKLKPGSLVDITVNSDEVAISTDDRREYTLEELVARITDDNIHPAADWGPPVGAEIW